MAEPQKPQMVTEIFGDTSFSRSTMYSPSQFRPYNPDDIVTKFGGAGTGLDKYEDMLYDDTVKAALATKKAAVLSSGWEIVPASDDAIDKKVAEFITTNLTDWYSGNFNAALEEVLSAMEFGFSITEEIYGITENFIVLQQLKTKPPQSFELHTDPYGNLLPDGLKQWDAFGRLISLPQDKFVIYSYNKRFGNWYGTSDLRAAYRPWFSKDAIIKFYNIYLERFGMPLMIARYAKNASSTDKTDLQGMLNRLQAKTSFVLPEEVEIEIKEAIKNSGGDYDKAIKLHETAITRSILMPNLLGFGETKGGSFALGQTQFDVLLWIVNKIRTDLEIVADEQILRRLVMLNFPMINKFPHLKFKPISQEDKLKIAELIIKAVTAGAITLDVDLENQLRDLLKLAQITKQAIAKKKEDDMEDEDEDEDEDERREFKLRRQPNKFESRMNFKAIEKAMFKDVETGIDELKVSLRKSRDDFTNQIVRKKIIETQNVALAGKQEMRFIRDIGLQLEGLLRNAKEKGFKASAAVAKKKKLARNPSGIGLVQGKAAMFVKEQSKNIVGELNGTLQNRSRDILLSGIKRGAPVNEVVDDLEKEFDKFTAVEGLEGADKTSGRLKTRVRTAYAEAFAVGMEEFNKPLEESGDIEAYRWSSIIDLNTTDGCDALNGLTFGVNNPYWNRVDPPRHWNCRSIKIPVFKGEEWAEAIPPVVGGKQCTREF